MTLMKWLNGPDDGVPRWWAMLFVVWIVLLFLVKAHKEGLLP